MFIFQRTRYSNVFIFLVKKGASVKYVRNWQLVGHGEVIQNTYSIQGEEMSCLMCAYALTLSRQYFCLIVSCFNCINLTFIQKIKRCVREERLFFSGKINFCRHQISLFYNTQNYFCEPKLGKTLLIL